MPMLQHPCLQRLRSVFGFPVVFVIRNGARPAVQGHYEAKCSRAAYKMQLCQQMKGMQLEHCRFDGCRQKHSNTWLLPVQPTHRSPTYQAACLLWTLTERLWLADQLKCPIGEDHACGEQLWQGMQKTQLRCVQHSLLSSSGPILADLLQTGADCQRNHCKHSQAAHCSIPADVHAQLEHAY